MIISLEQITEFFDHNRELFQEGRMTWNIDGECRWSFYFVDGSREALVPLADHLEAQGYEVVAIEDSEDTTDFFLQVDKVAAFSPSALYELGLGFDKLAEQFNVADYDGMDVGEV